GIVVVVEPYEINHTVHLAVKVQLLGLDINIAWQYVVKHDVIDKVRLVIFFVIKRLYVKQGYGKQPRYVFCILVIALDKNDVFGTPVSAERPVCVSVTGDGAGGI